LDAENIEVRAEGSGNLRKEVWNLFLLGLLAIITIIPKITS
jgi:hypothetical protein